MWSWWARTAAEGCDDGEEGQGSRTLLRYRNDGVGWLVPRTPALERLRQVDRQKFKAGLSYRVQTMSQKPPIEQRRPNNSPGSICVRISGPVGSGYWWSFSPLILQASGICIFRAPTVDMLEVSVLHVNKKLLPRLGRVFRNWLHLFSQPDSCF